MKKLRVVIAAILLFALLVGTGAANIPAPPVNQKVALYDTNMVNVSVDHSLPNSTTYACKDCHTNPRDSHHDMVTAGATVLGCLDCHPLSGSPLRLTISRNCHDCHDGTGFAANPAVNLSVLRGKPGRPHHNITKNNSAILEPTFQAAYWAADMKCTKCHGSTIVANYSDNHYIPDYSASSVTPFADFKVNQSGKLYGGCQACHEPDVTASPAIKDTEDTHHTARFWVGYQCNDCHVALGKYTPRTPGQGVFNDTTGEPINDYKSAPNAKYLNINFSTTYPAYVTAYGWDVTQKHVELRNSTMQAAGDTLNGTGCQKCHDVVTLHNIEGAALGMTAEQTRLANLPGYGHIGNNTDCNGCHQGWATPATDLNPFPGPNSIAITSVTPGLVSAGVATDVTLTGSGFVQSTYTTKVLVDGAEVTQKSITDSEIVVTVPALAAGTHAIQVDKGGSTSGLRELSAMGTVTIANAELASGVLTITGASFGSVDMKSVVVDKADGSQEASATTSWADGQIVANSAAAVGDSVTVVTGDGAATATITGIAPTPTPTPIPADSVTVTSPNGGESWKKGTTHAITWDRAGASQAANVKIDLMQGTKVVKTLVSSTPNDGTQSLNIGSITGTNFKIRITSVGHTPAYSDLSNNVFSIVR